MAQAGFTPISLYYSTTSTQEPAAADLVSGELAINIADGKLFYKNSGGNVRLLSIGYGSSTVTPTNGGVQYGTGTALALTAAGSSGQILRSNGAAAPTWADLSTLGVNTISFGTTGLTPNSATAGAVTVAGTLVTANGGTGLGGATPFTANGVLYASSASALTSGSALTFDGTIFSADTVNNTEFYVGAGQGTPIITLYGTSAASPVIGYRGSNGLRFGSVTGSGAGGLSEQMRLTSTGLGIGTSSPAAKLDVKGGSTISTLAGWNTLSNSMFELANPAVRFGIGYDSSDQVLLQAFDSSNAARSLALQVYGGGVGIGTSSPAAKLEVDGGTSSIVGLFKSSSGTATNLTLQQTGVRQYSLQLPASTNNFVIRDDSAASDRITLDSSGNLGLGVTPSAWVSSFKAFDLSTAGAVSGSANGAILWANAYLNSSSQVIRKSSGYTVRYVAAADVGQHIWLTGPYAASGGGVVSETQAMTLDASGNLLVGETSAGYSAASRGLIEVNGATTALFGLRVANVNKGYLYHAGTDMFLSNDANGALIVNTNSTERARITSGGDLLVGTTTTRTSNGQATQRLQIQGSAGTDGGAAVNSFGNDAFASNLDFFKSRGTGSTNTIVQSGDTLGKIWWSGADGTAYIQAAGITAQVDGTPGTNDMPGRLVFFTTADGATLVTERMRITSGGYFKASDNGTYLGSGSTYHEMRSTISEYITRFTNTNAAPIGLNIYYTAAAPNGTGNRFLVCEDNAATRAEIRSNGGLANYQSNNVDLSDARTKTDINPLDSYWSKIAGLEIVTYKYKDQTHDDLNIGVIAQQVEQVAPEFVDPDGFGETPEDGVPLKTIYNKDLTFAAIKALQEAMTRIETLEAKVAQLEGTQP